MNTQTKIFSIAWKSVSVFAVIIMTIAPMDSAWSLLWRIPLALILTGFYFSAIDEAVDSEPQQTKRKRVRNVTKSTSI